MKRFVSPLTFIIGLLGITASGCNNQTNEQTSQHAIKDTSVQTDPPDIPLKNWKPKSIFKIPITNVRKAKYPVIDMHAHDYSKNAEDLAVRVRVMDSVGLEKSVVFTNATGSKFDSIYALYSKYPTRFDVYCGFDLTNYQDSGWRQRAVNELRRCVKEGAVGVGELHDKGAGLTDGLHPDDPRMDALFDACAELKIPVNIHVSDPMWMYEPMDSTNDGLIRSWTWRIQGKDTAIDHAGLMVILANTIKRHPRTTFVASHLANCVYDFSILAKMFDQLPNMSADISARFAEFSTIPKTTAAFFEKYKDRLVYGTDYGWEIWSKKTDYGHNTTLDSMFRTTFRVLETNDEHFYLTDLVGYKWPMYGLGLSDAALRKIYHDNAAKIRKRS